MTDKKVTNTKGAERRTDIKSRENVIFQDNLEKYMNVNRLSPTGTFSKMVGAHPSRVYKWLDKTSEIMPNRSELNVIATLAGVSASDLLRKPLTFTRKVPVYNLGLISLYDNTRDLFSFVRFLDSFFWAEACMEGYAISVLPLDAGLGLEKDVEVKDVKIAIDLYSFSFIIPSGEGTITLGSEDIFTINRHEHQYNHSFRFYVRTNELSHFLITFSFTSLRDGK